MKKKVLIGIIAGVVVLVGMVLGVIFIIPNNDDGRMTTTSITNNLQKDEYYSDRLEFHLNLYSQEYSVIGIGYCKDQNIVIPNTYRGLPVTSIDSYAFECATHIKSIRIPDSVLSIGDMAFYGCTSLASIDVDEDNTYYKSINGDLYSKDGTVLKQYAIGKQDTTFTIPNSVTSIGNGAFCRSFSLTSIEIPDSVVSIGDLAFADCTSLTSMKIPYYVTSIGYRAFYRCISLASIEIPDSVMSIGNEAFNRCTSLTRITIPNSVSSIGDWAFDGCASLTSIAIGDSVTSIGEYAFFGCTSLTSITIPDSVVSIGDWAFAGCTSLTSLTIPDSVTSIGTWVFDGCTSLTSIDVDENNMYYKSIKGDLYSKDGTVLILYAMGKQNTSFTIPDCVTSIGVCAFQGCSLLTSITIPDSVTNIGAWAFTACTSLTSINYEGTVEQWNSIENDYSWRANIQKIEAICYDGTISLN